MTSSTFSFPATGAFETININKLLNQLNKAEKEIFDCNPKHLDWKILSQLNLYGIAQFFFKQDMTPPNQENQLINKFKDSYFDDIGRVFFNKGQKIKEVDLEKFFERIIYSPRVLK